MAKKQYPQTIKRLLSCKVLVNLFGYHCCVRGEGSSGESHIKEGGKKFKYKKEGKATSLNSY